MIKIGYIPLDDRAVNLLYPHYISKICNCYLVLPPKCLLGGYRSPADLDKILDWLDCSIYKFDYLILSIDMLAWGGLIHSRVPEANLEEAKKRLNKLKKIIERRKNNDKGLISRKNEFKVYAGNIITRLTGSVFDEESYKEWKDIYSFFEKFYKDAEPLAQKDNLELSSQVRNHLEVRRRNHLINLESVNLLKQGIINFLIFSQEDALSQGPHKIEQEIIQKELDKNNLKDFSQIQTGGDEVSMVLLSRLILKNVIKTDIKIYINFIFKDSENVIPLFEDRPVGESVKLQVKSSGAVEVCNASDADYILLIAIPIEGQIDILNPIGKRPLDCSSIKQNLKFFSNHSYIPIAIADLIYANGGCIELVKEISNLAYLKANSHEPTLRGGTIQGKICNFNSDNKNKILSYSGWNTANNSLGSVIATSNIITAMRKFHICHYERLKRARQSHDETLRFAQNINKVSKESQKYLILRLIEDVGYQAEVRGKINKLVVDKYKSSIYKLGKIKKTIEKEIQKNLIKWAEKNIRGFLPLRRIELISYLKGFEMFLPWDRTFEVGIRLKNKRRIV